MKRKWLFLILIIGFRIAAAQDMIVIGKVFVKESRQPLEAVNIMVKNTSIGTSTNSNGLFMLRLPLVEKQTLICSCIGYKKSEITLAKLQDQWIDIELEEENFVLDNIIIFPGENPAWSILRRVQEQKVQNNPDRKINTKITESEKVNFCFLNIGRKTLQNKIFRELSRGVLAKSDSSLILPVYFQTQKKQVVVGSEHDKREETVLQHNEKSLNAIGNENAANIVQEYVPQINFYNNHILLLGSHFASPLATSGRNYYLYALTDSSVFDGRKQYLIQFKPRNNKDLAFKGEMRVDSLTSALTYIKAQLPSTANINFVSQINIEHTFRAIDSTTWFYDEKHEDIAFQYNPFQSDKQQKKLTAVLQKQTIFDPIQPIDDKPIAVQPMMFDTIDKMHMQVIDSLNNTKIQRAAQYLVDLLLHGYAHAWKFDIGPLIDIYRYNKLEGHRLSFGMRTGESMMKYLTIGGFFGYGFGDCRWKYGCELQGRFGRNFAHTIGVFFSDNVEQYGTERETYFKENFVGEPYNMFSSIRLNFSDDFYRCRKASFNYKYEQRDWLLSFKTQHEQHFGTDLLLYTQAGEPLASFSDNTVQISSRIGFRQRYVQGFFHRYYLNNNLPVMMLQACYGHCVAGKKSSDYAKINFFFRHRFPLFGGKFYYSAEFGYIFGNAPWTSFDISKGSSGVWIRNNSFSLLQPMEFLSDIYGYAGFTYMTKGLIFNYIPWVKKINLREIISFQMIYGDLLNPHHADVLDFPVDYMLKKLVKPYMEFSIGISNILQFFSIESVWRLTHRNTANAANWGIRLRFSPGI